MKWFGFKNKKVKTLVEIKDPYEGLVEFKHDDELYWVTKEAYEKYLILNEQYKQDTITYENINRDLEKELQTVKFKVKSHYKYRRIDIWVYEVSLNTNCESSEWCINHGISVNTDSNSIINTGELRMSSWVTLERPIYKPYIEITFVCYINGDLSKPKYIHYKYDDIKDDPEFVLVK